MKKRINAKFFGNDIEGIIIFLCGFFSTMPLIALFVKSHCISLFTVFFFAELFFMFSKSMNGKIVMSGSIEWLIVWLFIAIISAVNGLLLSISHPVMMAAVLYIPKILLYVYFSINWSCSKSLKKNNTIIAKGILCGAVVNVLWSIADAILWYTTGLSISNIVFRRYMMVKNLSYIGLVMPNGLYRSGGLNFDPAHLGFLCPFLMLYSLVEKKYILFILSIGGLLSSGSTTGIVCAGFIFLLWYGRKVLHIKSINSYISSRTIFRAILFLLFAVIIVYAFRESLSGIISKAIKLICDRVETTYISKSDDFARFGGPRLDFLRFLPDALLRMGWLNILGTGLGTSVYAYSDVASMMEIKLNSVYDIENTYLAYYFDTGLIGFAVFFGMVIKAFLYFRKKCVNKLSLLQDSVAYAGIGSMLLSFLFYHYILFAPQVLIIIVALTQKNLERKSVKGEDMIRTTVRKECEIIS